MSNEASSTTNGDAGAPPSSREFTKMDLEIHTLFSPGTHPPADTMKVEINTEWDPSGDLGDFPKNIKRIVWAHRETGEQWIGLELTNTTFVYVHVFEETQEYLVVPVGNEEGLDFFKPLVLRRRDSPPEDFYPDEGVFDLADEF
jgi:hypothetical protein